jgi:hypothetical protein
VLDLSDGTGSTSSTSSTSNLFINCGSPQLVSFHAIKFQIPKENNKKCRNPQRFFIEKRQDSQRNTSHICRKSQYVTIKFSRLTEYAFPPSMCELEMAK